MNVLVLLNLPSSPVIIIMYSPHAGSVAPPAPNAIHPGAVAGIVIGILVGIANLVLLIALARNEGG